MLLSFLSLLSFVCAAIWIVILSLPWRPWSMREVLEAEPESKPVPGDAEVTVLIPARNESAVIRKTLQSLAAQGGSFKTIVVDDRSDDDTVEQARAVSSLNLEVIRGADLPEGWSGKLWALEQGLERVDTRYVLLLDADISLAPGTLAALLAPLRASKAGLVSVMAWVRKESIWDRLLKPAFIFFFKMLYPFHLANSADRRFSAAAGGCILAEMAAIRTIGGIGAIRGELIDDCALAARVKQAGIRTWIGVSHSVVSHRRYERLEPIWDMVARTAYSQLRYSPLLLGLCTALMVLLYWVPVIAILAPAPPQLPALIACVAIYFCYLPTLRFYGLNAGWGLAQPLIAALYLAMTWTSALRCWRGERSRWKGRSYR